MKDPRRKRVASDAAAPRTTGGEVEHMTTSRRRAATRQKTASVNRATLRALIARWRSRGKRDATHQRAVEHLAWWSLGDVGEWFVRRLGRQDLGFEAGESPMLDDGPQHRGVRRGVGPVVAVDREDRSASRCVGAPHQLRLVRNECSASVMRPVCSGVKAEPLGREIPCLNK